MDKFHWLELITVILNFLKQIQFEKDIQLLLFFVNISENLQENQGPKAVFWENYAFTLNNYVQGARYRLLQISH